jgi:hypothetical protein
MLYMLRWIDCVGGKIGTEKRPRPAYGKVAVQLDHGGFWRDRVRSINLYLVVILRLRSRHEEKCSRGDDQAERLQGWPRCVHIIMRTQPLPRVNRSVLIELTV